MYKSLKRLRVVGSIVIAMLLALGVADAWIGATPIGRLLMHAQLVGAILAGATLWIVLWVIVTIIFGRIYCSSMCPLGTLQDVAAHWGRASGKGAKGRYSYMRPLNGLRFPIPVVVAFCLFAGSTAVVQFTDPTYLYYRMVMAVARPMMIGLGGLLCAALVFVLIWTVAWRKGRLLCNTVCPLGGFLGLLSRSPIYRIDINTDKCIHCGKCEDVCKAHCINLQDCTVDNSRCVMCMNCTAVCPNDAIVLRRGRYGLSTPLMQPTTSTTCCVSPFLKSCGLHEKQQRHNLHKKERL